MKKVTVLVVVVAVALLGFLHPAAGQESEEALPFSDAFYNRFPLKVELNEVGRITSPYPRTVDFGGPMLYNLQGSGRRVSGSPLGLDLSLIVGESHFSAAATPTAMHVFVPLVSSSAGDDSLSLFSGEFFRVLVDQRGHSYPVLLKAGIEFWAMPQELLDLLTALDDARDLVLVLGREAELRIFDSFPDDNRPTELTLLFNVEMVRIVPRETGELLVRSNGPDPFFPKLVIPGERVNLLELELENPLPEDVEIREVGLFASFPNTLVNGQVLLSPTYGFEDESLEVVGSGNFTELETTASASFLIESGTKRYLRVFGEIAGISSAGRITESGALLRLQPHILPSGTADITTVGTFSGTAVDSIIRVPEAEMPGEVRVVRARSRFHGVNMFPELETGDSRLLFSFGITAEGGDVGEWQRTFEVVAEGVEVTDLRLEGFLDEGRTHEDGQFSSELLAVDEESGHGKWLVFRLMSSDGRPYVIPEAQTRWFELRATVSGRATAGSRIRVQAVGDTAPLFRSDRGGLFSAAEVEDTGARTVWSPDGAVELDSSGWTNGYGLYRGLGDYDGSMALHKLW